MTGNHCREHRCCPNSLSVISQIVFIGKCYPISRGYVDGTCMRVCAFIRNRSRSYVPQPPKYDEKVLIANIELNREGKLFDGFWNKQCNWDRLAKMQPLSEQFITRYIDRFDPRFIIAYQPHSMPQSFYEEYSFRINWLDVSRGTIQRPIPRVSINNIELYWHGEDECLEVLLDRYPDKIDWKVVSMRHCITFEFVDKFADKLYWPYLSHGGIDYEQLLKYESRIDWDYYSLTVPLEPGQLNRAMNKLNWMIISRRRDLTREVVTVFAQRIRWAVIVITYRYHPTFYSDDLKELIETKAASQSINILNKKVLDPNVMINMQKPGNNSRDSILTCLISCVHLTPSIISRMRYVHWTMYTTGIYGYGKEMQNIRQYYDNMNWPIVSALFHIFPKEILREYSHKLCWDSISESPELTDDCARVFESLIN